jgi:hypothetical protein
MNGRDPGWKPAIKGAWRGLVPYGIGVQSGRQKHPAVLFLRSLWLSLLVQWALFGVVLAFLVRNSIDDKRWTLFLTAGFGSVSLALLAWFRARPLKADDPPSLRDRYATASMIGFSLANAPVLMGFVSFFIGGGMPAYLLGVVFGLASFALMAPTLSNLDHFQRRLRESGVALSLLQALAEPLPPVEKKSGWPKRSGPTPPSAPS